MIDTDSSDLLRTLDVLNMPAFIVDKDRTVLSCNDNAQAFFEYDRSEVLGRNLEKFISMDSVLREREPSGLSPEAGAGRKGGSSSALRSFCFRKNNGPVAARIAVIPSRDLRQDRTFVIVRDASGQRTAPAAASSGHPGERTAQGELISELSSIINSSLSIGTIFRMVVSELRKIIDYSRASLLLYNENDDNLLIFALDTEMKTVMKKGVKAPIEGTSAGWVVRNNKPWISYDLTDTAFPLDRKLLAEGIRSTISVPLFHDRMLGVFNFDSTVPSQYSEKDFEILLPVARHIAVALENALLFEEISREKKEWERTFDAITDMVWIEDGKQRVVRANHTLLSRTGFSKFEIADRHCAELLDRIGIALTSGCLCSETLSCKKPSFQELKSGGGNIFHFWAYPLIDEDGRLYAIVHYLKDVTAQKRLEQQLIRSDKLASLGTLVAGVAHEINNPLGIIAAYSEALLDRSSEKALNGIKAFEDFPEYLRTIHNEIFRCKTILKSLLEFARPSGGTFREIDINELIKEVLLLLQHRTAKLKHTLELDLDREVPKIYADAGSLRQLMMNLLLNAIYFTPEGGSIFIKTETDDAPREDAVGACPNRIRLSVRDTGAGIPRDLINKVFDPFVTTKPVGEGTGLGLTICHKIVEEHGGAIDVESEPGKGATFIITLPSIGCRD
ncbi:MAG TPA: ATP-binding protein [Nitrospirota bacterium]|nr:ATP-binding protein [Nitrospirota bacterium]